MTYKKCFELAQDESLYASYERNTSEAIAFLKSLSQSVSNHPGSEGRIRHLAELTCSMWEYHTVVMKGTVIWAERYKDDSELIKELARSLYIR